MSKNDHIALLRSELTALETLILEIIFHDFQLEPPLEALVCCLCKAGVPNLHDIMPDVLKWS